MWLLNQDAYIMITIADTPANGPVSLEEMKLRVMKVLLRRHFSFSSVAQVHNMLFVGASSCFILSCPHDSLFSRIESMLAQCVAIFCSWYWKKMAIRFYFLDVGAQFSASIEKVFCCLDSDGNGFLDRNELKAGFASMVSSCPDIPNRGVHNPM
jgi:hypothetical protein